MNTLRFITALILALMLSMNTTAQEIEQKKSKAEVVNLDYEVKDTKLIATYDIVNYGRNETFDIQFLAITQQQDTIPAKSLTGDIDSNITGGYNKKIEWDLMKDKIVINDSLLIKIIAKSGLYTKEEE